MSVLDEEPLDGPPGLNGVELLLGGWVSDEGVGGARLVVADIPGFIKSPEEPAATGAFLPDEALPLEEVDKIVASVIGGELALQGFFLFINRPVSLGSTTMP
jgi:hypothetical protein